jgi:hypothetical protein
MHQPLQVLRQVPSLLPQALPTGFYRLEVLPQGR